LLTKSNIRHFSPVLVPYATTEIENAGKYAVWLRKMLFKYKFKHSKTRSKKSKMNSSYYAGSKRQKFFSKLWQSIATAEWWQR